MRNNRNNQELVERFFVDERPPTTEEKYEIANELSDLLNENFTFEQQETIDTNETSLTDEGQGPLDMLKETAESAFATAKGLGKLGLWAASAGFKVADRLLMGGPEVAE